MLESLADPILPVFAVMALGFLLGKLGILGATDAASINRFAFYLGVPALVLWVVASAPLERFDWRAIGLYFSAQVVVFVVLFSLLKALMRVELREALLLAMAAVLVNHIFFVLPIAERVLGPEAGIPMAGIVMLDAGILFPITVLITARLSEGGGGMTRLLLGNPFIYAPPLGLILGLMGSAAPQGVLTFAEFAGGAAAPVLLFALGITLAGRADGGWGPVLWLVVAAKLALHPALTAMLMRAASIPALTSDITLMVAAGPCGAMPFVIATQYNVNPGRIARVILLSTLLSVLLLAWLTG